MEENLDIAIIDADFITYVATNKMKIYEYGIPKKDEKGNFIYRDKTLEEAINTCDSYIYDLLHLCRAKYYIFCLTSRINFRHSIDSSYKANRVGLVRPQWYKEVNKHLKDNWYAFEVTGLEADDLVCIIKNKTPNSFIVAVDKDILFSKPGIHFNARKGVGQFINVSQEQANFEFAKSILIGDKIDGIPNLKKGYGEKSAEKELLASQDLDLKDTCLKIYQREFGEVEGMYKFMTQVNLLKIIENFDELPEGITFDIPQPICYDCVGEYFSQEQFKININNG